MVTPKALANFSPGLERSDNPGYLRLTSGLTLKALASARARKWRNAFSVASHRLDLAPGLREAR